MSKADIWMPLYLGDFFKDTISLTPDERSFYLMTLVYLWTLKGEASLEDLRVATGYSRTIFEKKFKKISKFFEKKDDLFSQKRLSIELAKAIKNSETNSKSALLRWRGNANASANVLHLDMQKACSSPSPSSSTVLLQSNNSLFSSLPSVESKEQYEEKVSTWKRQLVENHTVHSQYVKAFPGVDILLELENASLWLTNNFSRKKKNFNRFFQNWCSRKQEKGFSQRREAFIPKTNYLN